MGAPSTRAIPDALLRNDPIARAAFVKRLRAALAYDPETGLFTNLVQRRQSKPGAVVGQLGAGGYVRVTFEYCRFMAHRLAWLHMTGDWPSDKIDHRDLDRSNNRWSNLREATQSQNCANAPLTRRNTSGFKGACFDKSNGKFVASVRFQGRHIHLGHFDTAYEAHLAYVAGAHRLFGEFARAG